MPNVENMSIIAVKQKEEEKILIQIQTCKRVKERWIFEDMSVYCFLNSGLMLNNWILKIKIYLPMLKRYQRGHKKRAHPTTLIKKDLKTPKMCNYDKVQSFFELGRHEPHLESHLISIPQAFHFRKAPEPWLHPFHTPNQP